jgi:3-hydroxyisobutyrate dehydrogenase-like beta-hydroxyacid dehydrogenase
MGRPIARHLVSRGFEVVVFDISQVRSRSMMAWDASVCHRVC